MSNSQISRKNARSRQPIGWRALWPVWTICTLLLLYGVVVFVGDHWADLPHRSDTPVVVLAEGQDVHLDSRNLGTSQLHLFEAKASGQKVKFIVERSSDKVVHVAVASCSACYRNQNSHYAKNGTMMCGQCKEAMDFESRGRQTGTDRCALVELPHTEADGEVAVLARDVFALVAKIPQ